MSEKNYARRLTPQIHVAHIHVAHYHATTSWANAPRRKTVVESRQ